LSTTHVTRDFSEKLLGFGSGLLCAQFADVARITNAFLRLPMTTLKPRPSVSRAFNRFRQGIILVYAVLAPA